jgi:aspartyl-tRNA(Asn)/glutamyl-tRNA(Gln) amidotransferase subunit A
MQTTSFELSSPFDSVRAMSAGLTAGRITSVQLVTRCLDRIREHDGVLHAFSEVYAEEALLAAEAADRQLRAAVRLGPLHGIPVALKDLVDMAGKVTTNGSPLFAKRVAQKSARIVQLLHAAGAVIVGKTHMVQFALGAWGTNEHMGTPRNPWDAKVHRTPGGSSSGSAVAVAAGLVPLAIGTDTGGSVRVPAAFCGITGFKASASAIDTTGVLPLSTTLDSIGVFAQTAEDAVLLYRVLAEDRSLAGEPIAAPPAPDLQGVRVARLADADLAGVAPEVRAAYETAIEEFRGAGAHVSTLPMPRPLDTFAQTASSIMLSEAAVEWGDLAADVAREMDPSVRPRIVAGSRISATEYVRAMRQREAWKREFSQLLARFDVIATPSTMTTAVPVEMVDHNTAPVRYTRILNLLDMCGVSLPVGVDSDGLPIGLQLGAQEGADLQLAAVAQAFQARTSYHMRRANLRAFL